MYEFIDLFLNDADVFMSVMVIPVVLILALLIWPFINH